MFGLNDIALSAIKENAKEILKSSCLEAESEVEVAGESSTFQKSSFRSSDFGKPDMKPDEDMNSSQFDNIGNSPEAIQVEKSFLSRNFEEAQKGNIENSNEISEEADPQTVYMERKTQNTSTETHMAGFHNASNISFGNLYDERTIGFLKDCKKYDIDLPTSVTHAGYGIDRSVNGGLQNIDKNLIETALKTAVERSKISKEVYEELHHKLISC